MEEAQKATDEKIDDLKQSIDDLKKSNDGLPGKIALYVTIIGGILLILSFLGPSLKKVMGMSAQTHSTVLAQESAHIPDIH